jgi:hypothetical protein
MRAGDVPLVVRVQQSFDSVHVLGFSVTNVSRSSRAYRTRERTLKYRGPSPFPAARHFRSVYGANPVNSAASCVSRNFFSPAVVAVFVMGMNSVSHAFHESKHRDTTGHVICTQWMQRCRVSLQRCRLTLQHIDSTETNNGRGLWPLPLNCIGLCLGSANQRLRCLVACGRRWLLRHPHLDGFRRRHGR